MHTLQEIEKRLAELNGLVDTETDPEKLAAYEKEVRSLIQEKGEILGEQRAKARASARAAFTDPANVVNPNQNDGDVEARAKEWIDAAKKGNGIIPCAEARSVLVSSGSLATPTSVSSGIMDQMNKVPSLITSVFVEDHNGEGEHQVAYVKTESEAVKDPDNGSAPSNTGAAFGYVKIKPYPIVCVDYISKLTANRSPIDYKNKVSALAMKAIRKKVVDIIINGVTESGSLVTYGLLNGVDKDGAPMYQSATLAAAIGANTLRDIALNYGSDDTIDGPATLILRKDALLKFGAVRGTNEKRALYTIEYAPGSQTEGVLSEGGISVRFVISSKLPAGKMVYGILPNYELDLFSDVKVEIDGSYKFAEGMDTVRATADVGGNIIVPNGVCVITQHSTGAGTTESPTVYD